MKDNEKRVRDICRKYRYAKQGVTYAEKGVEVIKKRIESATTEREKKLQELALESKMNELNLLKNIIESFNICISVLPEEERSVIYQLYVKGMKWDDVCDSSGSKYSKATIMAIRQRALRKMAQFITA